MLPFNADYPPELWERIQSLFEKVTDAEDAEAVLAAESDSSVANAAASLYRYHQKAQGERFLDEPITLIRHLDPENAPPEAFPDWDGRVVSHFRILRKLGEGGMGKVYLAEDLTLHRQVALKFLALKPHADPRGFLERFRREARAAAALKHPHICTIHWVQEFDGQPAIEMEFVEGETLAERIANGALPPEEALPSPCRLPVPWRRPAKVSYTAISSLPMSCSPNSASRCWISAWRRSTLARDMGDESHNPDVHHWEFERCSRDRPRIY